MQFPRNLELRGLNSQGCKATRETLYGSTFMQIRGKGISDALRGGVVPIFGFSHVIEI
ncbi:hypothetical protein VULLAG_LOCUS5746 [Vulpes lagopus]